jgi:hypothetical protein
MPMTFVSPLNERPSAMQPWEQPLDVRIASAQQSVREKIDRKLETDSTK